MAQDSVKRTGMIGLGAMGSQMGRHMASKGFEGHGYDINAEANAGAKGHGVRICGSPAEVGRNADVVVVMVATDDQINDVVVKLGLLDTFQLGAVICIASSCSPETCRDLAKLAAAKGIGVLDCPVVLG